MVGAPQPTTKEDHRPSHPSYSMRANLRHTWYDGITHTHTHSGSRLPNRSAHIRQCLCRFSGERCISQAIYECQWEWVSGEGHCEYRLFLAAPQFVPLRATFRPVGTLRLGVRSPNIFIFFVMQIIARQCIARAMFLRRSNVIFMEIMCTVPKSPCLSRVTANASQA